jgi:hypothetical protein
MFFQEATPDTSGYMIAGYAIAFIVMAIYVASIYLRSRNLNQDRTMLEEMDKSAQRVEVRQPKKNPVKSSGNNKSVKPVTKRSTKK